MQHTNSGLIQLVFLEKGEKMKFIYFFLFLWLNDTHSCRASQSSANVSEIESKVNHLWFCSLDFKLWPYLIALFSSFLDYKCKIIVTLNLFCIVQSNMTIYNTVGSLQILI